MAIIAVLVAIAVPLFVGQINEARKTTFEANQRAAKGAVIAAILKEGKELSTTETNYTVKVNTKTGEIGDITKGGEKATADYETWQATGKDDPKNGVIIVTIQSTDLEIKEGE